MDGILGPGVVRADSSADQCRRLSAVVPDFHHQRWSGKNYQIVFLWKFFSPRYSRRSQSPLPRERGRGLRSGTNRELFKGWGEGVVVVGCGHRHHCALLCAVYVMYVAYVGYSSWRVCILRV